MTALDVGERSVALAPPPLNWVVHARAPFGLCGTAVEKLLIWIPIIISNLISMLYYGTWGCLVLRKFSILKYEFQAQFQNVNG